MKLDHAAALRMAETILSLPAAQHKSLANCYLDSVPKEKYGELLRLACALDKSIGYGDADILAAVRKLRAFIEKEKGNG